MSRTMIAAVAGRIGHRGAALLAFACLDAVIGWSLLDAQGQAQARAIPAYAAIRAMLPLSVWGWLWIAVSATCAVSAFMRSDRAGFAGAIGVKAVWAGGLLVAWWPMHVPRAWLGAAVWVVLALLVLVISDWPDPPVPPPAPARTPGPRR